MAATIREFLLENAGVWFSPNEVAEQGNFHIMSVYAALQDLVETEPALFEKEKDDNKRTQYRARGEPK